MRFTKQPTTTTHNGGVAYSLSDKQELIKMCLISFLQSDFYEKDTDKITAIQDLVSRLDPDWVMRLAKFSRDYGLRSINHVLFVEAAKGFYGKKGSRAKLTKYLTEMIRRPDELLDIVGYYTQRNGQNFNSIILPNALKEAVKEALQGFNDYQIAKYRGKGDALNLYDLVTMVHAKSDTLSKLMTGTLESADTWEVELSKNGNTKEGWTRLLAEKKLGALATVRNLRNMLEVGVEGLPEYLDTIKWSDVFPFQALQALDMTAELHSQEISDVIQKHVKECFKFISERYPGKIAIGVDVSGSMFNTSVSGLSKMDRAKMAVMYGMILQEITGGDLYFWSSRCVPVQKDLSFEQAMKIAEQNCGSTYVGTFTSEIAGKGYDYAIILTDEQINDNLSHVADKQTIVWGLHDYKNTIVSGNGVTYFTGYNDIMWKIGADLFRLGELEKAI